MIWLIGKSGLLGQEIAQMLEQEKLLYIGTGHEVDITDINELKKFADDIDGMSHPDLNFMQTFVQSRNVSTYWND